MWPYASVFSPPRPLPLPRPGCFAGGASVVRSECCGPFQPCMFGKGQRPLGWLWEWQISQVKRFRQTPVLFRADGYVRVHTYFWSFDQAIIFEVGEVTYMFHLGEDVPPCALRSRSSERTDRIMSWMAVSAWVCALILENFGSCATRIPASVSMAAGWLQAVLIESTTASSSGYMYPARHSMMEGMTLGSKGYASKVTCGTDHTRWASTMSPVGELLGDFVDQEGPRRRGIRGGGCARGGDFEGGPMKPFVGCYYL